jgi:hypothetical protein
MMEQFTFEEVLGRLVRERTDLEKDLEEVMSKLEGNKRQHLVLKKNRLEIELAYTKAVIGFVMKKRGG